MELSEGKKAALVAKQVFSLLVQREELVVTQTTNGDAEGDPVPDASSPTGFLPPAKAVDGTEMVRSYSFRHNEIQEALNRLRAVYKDVWEQALEIVRAL